jgi:hypothetical protein
LRQSRPSSRRRTDHLERILSVCEHVHGLLRLLGDDGRLQRRSIFRQPLGGLGHLLLDLDQRRARVLAPRAAAQLSDAPRLLKPALEPLVREAAARTDRGRGVCGGVESGGEDCSSLDAWKVER